MTGNGVRVINYSRTSSVLMDGMGDGTSPYSDSDYALLDAAVAGGALFVASAGNSGDAYWGGPSTDVDLDGRVEFGPGMEDNSLRLERGQTVLVSLRWADPASDYDVGLWRDGILVTGSAEDQAETGDAVEVFSYRASVSGTYRLGIEHNGGAEAPFLRLMINGAGPLHLRTTAGSLPTPADSRNPGMVAVGAVNYRTPTVIEPYSSRGPTLDGRIKPDLVAADCAPTTIEAEFCGTSQSAPLATAPPPCSWRPTRR